MQRIQITDKELKDYTGFVVALLAWFVVWVSVGMSLARREAVAYTEDTKEAEEIDNTTLVATPPEYELTALEYVPDNRAEKIENYLRNYGSPYPELASTIVEVSDRYGVNPYVITAISCQESSCFKNCHNSNCSGYGITDSGIVLETRLGSLEAGIEDMVSRYATDWNGYYKNCGDDIACIGRKYNPRESWRSNVVWFYNNISSFE